MNCMRLGLLATSLNFLIACGGVEVDLDRPSNQLSDVECAVHLDRIVQSGRDDVPWGVEPVLPPGASLDISVSVEDTAELAREVLIYVHQASYAAELVAPFAYQLTARGPRLRGPVLIRALDSEHKCSEDFVIVQMN